MNETWWVGGVLSACLNDEMEKKLRTRLDEMGVREKSSGCVKRILGPGKRISLEMR